MPVGLRAVIYFPTILVVYLSLSGLGVSHAICFFAALICGLFVLELADERWELQHSDDDPE